MYGGNRLTVNTPPDFLAELEGNREKQIEPEIIESEPEFDTKFDDIPPPPHRFADREPDAPLQYPTLFNADGTLSDRFRRVYETVERFNEEVAGELEDKLLEYVYESRRADGRRMDVSVLSRLPSIPAKLTPEQYMRIVSEAASDRESWKLGGGRFGRMFDAIFRVPLLYFKICVSTSDAVKAKHLEELLRLGAHFDNKAIVTKAMSLITNAIDDMLGQTSTLELSGEERAALAKYVGNKMPKYWKKIKINHAAKNTTIPPDVIGEEIDNLYSLIEAIPGRSSSSVALKLSQKNELRNTDTIYPVKVSVEKQCGCFMLVKVLEQRTQKKYWMFSDNCADNYNRLCHVFVDGALLHGRYKFRESRREPRLSLNEPNNYVARVAATNKYGKSYQVIREDGVHFAIKLFNEKMRFESAKASLRLVQAGFRKGTDHKYINFGETRNSIGVFYDPEEEKKIRDWIADIDLPKVGDKVLVMKSLKLSNPSPDIGHMWSETPVRVYEMVNKVCMLCAYFYTLHPDQNVVDWRIDNFIWNHFGEMMLVDFEFRKEFTMHDVHSGYNYFQPSFNPVDYQVKYAPLVACLNTCFAITQHCINMDPSKHEIHLQYEMTKKLVSYVAEIMIHKSATIKPVYKPNSRQKLPSLKKKPESVKIQIGKAIQDRISDFNRNMQQTWGIQRGGGAVRNKGSGSKLVCAGILFVAMLAAAFVPT